MLEKVNLKKSLSAKEYKKESQRLHRRLFDLEKACWDHQIASILIFEGWDAAGKGSAIATLTARLDPRGFKLHPIQAPRTFERNRPWLWRFWLRLPNYGEMAIFDRSWYRRLLDEYVEGEIDEAGRRRAFEDIIDLERMLADDGVVLIKFWLHISKKEQKRRFKEIEKDPFESWRITAEDWARHKLYDRYLLAAEEMLERTESEYGPWTIVEATCKYFAQRKIFHTVIAALEKRLGDKAPPEEAGDASRALDRELMDAMEAAEARR